jgi:radical SAM superfamily enzyme YgiQ (UPF0313 family)
MRVLFASATYSTFITFNRRFLGLGYLHAYALTDPRVASACTLEHEFYETMHRDMKDVAAQIAADEPDVVGFACYVWNTPDVLRIAAHLEAMLPGVTIVLGGPEVSYHYVKILEANPAVDFIVVGEGEETFRELLLHRLGQGRAIEAIDGLTYRDAEGKAIANAPRAYEKELDRFPSPYLTGVLDVDDLVGGAYFQTTRGCPFTCTYCDYGRNQPYFEFSMERVAAEFDFFQRSGARVFFCADATFNYKRNRANQILQLAIDRDLDAMLWIEVFPSLINDELVEQLAKMKRVFCGVGIQTTNPVTMKNIHRVWKPEMITEKLDKIARLQNCWLGLELIMGLPGDDLETFKDTLDWSYERDANQIFALNLQILPRTPLEGEVEKYRITTLGPEAGHEVTSNCTFSEREILIGKAITSWHRLFQPVFARLAAVSGKKPGDLIELWAFRSYEAGLYDRIEAYHHNIITPEVFDPLRDAFRRYLEEVLADRDAVSLVDLFTDFFRYLYVRRSATREGAFVTDIFDLNCITFRPKDQRVLAALRDELVLLSATSETLRPRCASEVRFETYGCDMRDLWPLRTRDEWHAITRRPVTYAIYTEPKTGAGRSVIVDDVARATIERCDGNRSLADIARELEPSLGTGALDHVKAIYDILAKAGLAADADAPFDPNSHRVGVHSTSFATYF